MNPLLVIINFYKNHANGAYICHPNYSDVIMVSFK